jgi:hypothetical protein|tara:strand:- start:664 stop:1086 length:423 start_codon:yes stop_codon:yes gene_type:complete
VPLYETDGDRLHEERVALVTGEAWGMTALRLPVLSEPCDYLLHRDGVVAALMEIKRRTTASDTYRTYMLSVRKVNQMCDIANAMRIEAWVVVEFSDGIFCANAHDMSRCPVYHGGRYDRSDSTAIEPMYHMEYTQLRRVE